MRSSIESPSPQLIFHFSSNSIEEEDSLLFLTDISHWRLVRWCLNFNHLTHERPCFGIPVETLIRKLDGLMRGFDGEMALQTRVYELVEASPSPQIGSSPFNQIVLAVWSLLVHGSTAGQNFKEDNSKAVDITL
ncbi:hypothetical protein IEQ34_022949 [Dendrobium chrysotoxum]|uniref:Cytochrome P450 n=1 Tax=Dendrobium chrysotoxum TaxID=161865 RepID=A0AAV7G0D0_DENCH|nr:hypothetical protein IEQ34_022949 [Dendrobium chrysotoxum]